MSVVNLFVSTKVSAGAMMSDSHISEHRLQAAAAARAYLEKKISRDTFMEEFSGSRDERIQELVDLIEHEPKVGGFFGANAVEWSHYQSALVEVIVLLESD